ncbi:hypothetical protein GC173_08670 [bacterium]|nr:hypothetical protein [bacterium]
MRPVRPGFHDAQGGQAPQHRDTDLPGQGPFGPAGPRTIPVRPLLSRHSGCHAECGGSGRVHGPQHRWQVLRHVPFRHRRGWQEDLLRLLSGR